VTCDRSVVFSGSPCDRSVVFSGYVMKFVSDLRQVGGFLRVLDITEILLKVPLNTITITLYIL